MEWKCEKSQVSVSLVNLFDIGSLIFKTGVYWFSSKKCIKWDQIGYTLSKEVATLAHDSLSW